MFQIDTLIEGVKKARMAANRAEASKDKIGQTVINFIHRPLGGSQ